MVSGREHGMVNVVHTRRFAPTDRPNKEGSVFPDNSQRFRISDIQPEYFILVLKEPPSWLGYLKVSNRWDRPREAKHIRLLVDMEADTFNGNWHALISTWDSHLHVSHDKDKSRPCIDNALSTHRLSYHAMALTLMCLYLAVCLYLAETSAIISVSFTTWILIDTIFISM
jgi:hypothetical protein